MFYNLRTSEIAIINNNDYKTDITITFIIFTIFYNDSFVSNIILWSRLPIFAWSNHGIYLKLFLQYIINPVVCSAWRTMGRWYIILIFFNRTCDARATEYWNVRFNTKYNIRQGHGWRAYALRSYQFIIFIRRISRQCIRNKMFTTASL